MFKPVNYNLNSNFLAKSATNLTSYLISVGHLTNLNLKQCLMFKWVEGGGSVQLTS